MARERTREAIELTPDFNNGTSTITLLYAKQDIEEG
jgi:hypothetical protein